MQLGGDLSHWSVLRQLATLDSLSPIGTLIAIVGIFDGVSALTSTERWLIVCFFCFFLWCCKQSCKARFEKWQRFGQHLLQRDPKKNKGLRRLKVPLKNVLKTY